MSKCFLLGAGASYGYDENIPKIDRIPVGNQIISKGISTGILSAERYSRLFSLIEYYIDQHPDAAKSFEKVDFEDVMDWGSKLLSTPLKNLAASDPQKFDNMMTQKFRDYPNRKKEYLESSLKTYLEQNDAFFREHPDLLTEARNKRFEIDEPLFRMQMAEQLDHKELKLSESDIHIGIGESLYFIFELMRYYSINYKPNFDCYQRLALHHLKENYSVISLNYDVLFELAILNAGLLYSYPVPEDPALKEKTPLFSSQVLGWPGSFKVVNIAKVNGSINWLNPNRAISMGNSKVNVYELIRMVGGLPYTNRFMTGQSVILNPQVMATFGLRDLLVAGNEYYEPVLLPPIGEYKDYEKFRYVFRNIEAARHILSGSDELVVIGSSIRSQDSMLRELIRSNCGNVKRATVVSKSKGSEAKSTLQELMQSNPPDIEIVETFEDYCKTL